MKEQHDFKGALDKIINHKEQLFPHITHLIDNRTDGEILLALRIADRLQSGEVSMKMVTSWLVAGDAVLNTAEQHACKS